VVAVIKVVKSIQPMSSDFSLCLPLTIQSWSDCSLFASLLLGCLQGIYIVNTHKFPWSLISRRSSTKISWNFGI